MRGYLHSVDPEWYRCRLTKAMILVTSVFAVLLARLFYLQVVEGEEYRRRSENNRVRFEDIPARAAVSSRGMDIPWWTTARPST